MFFSEGLCSTFVEGLWQMTWVVHEGRLDHYLLRPIPPLLSVLCQRVGMHGFGMILVGAVLLANALTSGIVVNPALLWLVPPILMCGFLIRAAIVLITNCSIFWFPGMGVSLAVAVNDISDFAKYPLSIYALGIQALITWVLPFAFVAAIPAAALAGRAGGELIWALPVVTFVLGAVALVVFRRGVARYEGAGH
jgi:ABC-2 type transport system permease protein